MMEYIGCLTDHHHAFIQVLDANDHQGKIRLQATTLDGKITDGVLLGEEEEKPHIDGILTKEFVKKLGNHNADAKIIQMVFRLEGDRFSSIELFYDDEEIYPKNVKSSLKILNPTKIADLRSNFSMGGEKRNFDARTQDYIAENIINNRDLFDAGRHRGYYVNANIIRIYKAIELGYSINIDEYQNNCYEFIDKIGDASGNIVNYKLSVREDPISLHLSLMSAVMNYHAVKGDIGKSMDAALEIQKWASQRQLRRSIYFFNLCKAALYSAMIYHIAGNNDMAIHMCERTVEYFYASTSHRVKNYMWFYELTYHHDCAVRSLKLMEFIEKQEEPDPGLIRKAFTTSLRVTLPSDFVKKTTELVKLWSQQQGGCIAGPDVQAQY